jgi:8-oxo-dGTP pyrophosphatase MutT (NUDIX family)
VPRTLRRLDDLRSTADAQLGLITAAQLQELGIKPSAATRKLAGGMWTRVLPGVHLVHGGEPTRRQRELATMLYAADPSCLTGLTAVRRYGVRAMRLQETADDDVLRPEPVHVLVPHSRRSKSTGFARIERTRRFPDVLVRRSGLVLAPLDRAVTDAARRMGKARDVQALVTEVLQRGMCSFDDLVEELELGQIRGSAHLRAALHAVSLGAASPPEVDLRELFEELGLEHVHYNVAILTTKGELVGLPDAWLDDVGLAVEVDSVLHHSDVRGFERTVRRNARYAVAGVPCIPVLPTDLRDRRRETGARVLAARDAASARPRPHVRMAPAAAHRSAGQDGWRWGA